MGYRLGSLAIEDGHSSPKGTVRALADAVSARLMEVVERAEAEQAKTAPLNQRGPTADGERDLGDDETAQVHFLRGPKAR